MRKTTIVWLVIAAALVVIGASIFALVMSAYNWDFAVLSTGKYETNAYEINEEFSGISMNTDTADILFAVSDDDVCRVICYEQENIKHSVGVQDSILTVDVVDERKWYEYIGINFNATKVTVYLPEAEYTSLIIKESTGDVEISNGLKFAGVDISLTTGDVGFFAGTSESMKIKTSTGDIRVKNISAGAIDLAVSTGNVTVSDVTCEGDVNINVSTGRTNITDTRCKNLISGGSTGDLILKNVIAEGTFSAERSTGDVKLDGSDAAEIFIKTNTGDVTGDLLTQKVFITQTDTGSIDVPKTISGGKCEISSKTGDIKITVGHP